MTFRCVSSSYHTIKCIDRLHWHRKLLESWISIENSGQP